MYELQTLLTRLRIDREQHLKERIITRLQPIWLRLHELKFPWLKVLFPLLALGALAAGLIWSRLQLDALLLGALLVASWPWVWSYLQNRTMPGAPHVELVAIKARQKQQQAEIDRLVTFLLHHYLKGSEFQYLHKLAASESFLIRKSESTERFIGDLRRLYALGLIDRVAGQGFRTLLEALQRQAGQEHGVDVKAYFFITDQGKKYLALLQSELAAFLSDS